MRISLESGTVKCSSGYRLFESLRVILWILVSGLFPVIGLALFSNIVTALATFILSFLALGLVLRRNYRHGQEHDDRLTEERRLSGFARYLELVGGETSEQMEDS